MGIYYCAAVGLKKRSRVDYSDDHRMVTTTVIDKYLSAFGVVASNLYEAEGKAQAVLDVIKGCPDAEGYDGWDVIVNRLGERAVIEDPTSTKVYSRVTLSPLREGDVIITPNQE